MKAIRKNNNYLTFSIEANGNDTLCSLMKDALIHSNKIFVDELFELDELPVYKTQMPYSSGFIQDRYVYFNSKDCRLFIITNLSNDDAYDLFLCRYPCWDLYKEVTLVASINIVEGIITVNSDYIDLSKYNFAGEEGNHES